MGSKKTQNGSGRLIPSKCDHHVPGTWWDNSWFWEGWAAYIERTMCSQSHCLFPCPSQPRVHSNLLTQNDISPFHGALVGNDLSWVVRNAFSPPPVPLAMSPWQCHSDHGFSPEIKVSEVLKCQMSLLPS